MRTLTPTSLAAMFAQETDEVFLRLLEINHDDWAQPFRLAQNTNDVVSDGNTYSQWPFQIEPPNDSAAEVAQVTLQLDNTDRSILRALRSLRLTPGKTFASVTFFLVLASDKDTVVGDTYVFQLRQVQSYNAHTLSCVLLFDAVLSEMVPADRMTPAKNPGLFTGDN